MKRRKQRKDYFWEVLIVLLFICMLINRHTPKKEVIYAREINDMPSITTEEVVEQDQEEIEEYLNSKTYSFMEEKVTSRGEYERSNKFKITAYCSCEKCCGKWAKYNKTASGTTPEQGRTIAVYKSQIPLGTEVYIDGLGTYVAEDTGSAIKENCIDLYFDDHNEALKFGVQYIEVSW